MITETDKPEKMEQLLRGLVEKVEFYRADPHDDKGAAMEFIFPYARHDEAIMKMERDIRESIKDICPFPRKHDYIQGYLEGRLNAILIIEDKLLGKKVDWSKEV